MDTQLMLSKTARKITAYADGLQAAGARKPASCLRMLAGFLGEFGDRSMAELMECQTKVTGVRSPGPRNNKPLVADAIAHLSALEKILTVSNDEVQATDLRLLIKLLATDSGYLSPMLDALRRAFTRDDAETDVTQYVERLKKDMGTEAFEQTLGELAASSLTREQVVRVALAVYGGIPKSTSRKAAMKFIRKPHDARVSARRGIDAMGGRSAA